MNFKIFNFAYSGIRSSGPEIISPAPPFKSSKNAIVSLRSNTNTNMKSCFLHPSFTLLISFWPKEKHNQLKTQLRIWTVFFFTTNPGYLFKQVFICYHIQLPLYRNRKRKSMWLIKDLWGDCSFSNIKSILSKFWFV